MKATIESKKIVEYSKRGSNEKSIDIITVKYPASFLKNINKRGRVKKENNTERFLPGCKGKFYFKKWKWSKKHWE